jgi:hypothetical protein
MMKRKAFEESERDSLRSTKPDLARNLKITDAMCEQAKKTGAPHLFSSAVLALLLAATVSLTGCSGGSEELKVAEASYGGQAADSTGHPLDPPARFLWVWVTLPGGNAALGGGVPRAGRFDWVRVDYPSGAVTYKASDFHVVAPNGTTRPGFVLADTGDMIAIGFVVPEDPAWSTGLSIRLADGQPKRLPKISKGRHP